MAVKTKLRWQAVALPVAHGTWGLILEPIALGLLLAFTWAGLALALGIFFAFLAYQPLRIAWKDLREQRQHRRTWLARRFAFFFSAASGLFLLAVVWGAGWRPLLPTLLAAPLLLLFLRYDLDGARRTWQAEISAALVFSSVVAGMALAAAWALPNALVLWALMAARGVPSMLYVRARLRLDKGKAAGRWGVWLAHLLALALGALLVQGGRLPALALAALLLLLLRAALGLSRYRRTLRAQVIGFSEIGLGALTVLLVVLGMRLGL